jgi:hypothetical protein
MSWKAPMATTEFLKASRRSSSCSAAVAGALDVPTAGSPNATAGHAGPAIHSAVAQATQQAAATAAAEAVHEAMATAHAQKEQPTEQYVAICSGQVRRDESWAAARSTSPEGWPGWSVPEAQNHRGGTRLGSLGQISSPLHRESAAQTALGGSILLLSKGTRPRPNFTF